MSILEDMAAGFLAAREPKLWRLGPSAWHGLHAALDRRVELTEHVGLPIERTTDFRGWEIVDADQTGLDPGETEGVA